MKLNYITIMVRDIEKSVMFYEELVGLQVMKRFNPGKGQIVFLSNAIEETMLELIQFEDAEKVSTKGLVMSFSAGSELITLREKTISLGYAPSEIIEHETKPTYFRVSDPDGITIEFSV